MHIPDGYISVATAAAGWVGSVGAIAYSTRRANRALREREVPLMGVMAAFIFAAQMINFRVAAGTSGHLVGATLVAILLGPWVGTLVITAVLVIQAFVFQDGGLIAPGANILNMAVIGVWVGRGIYVVLSRIVPGKRGMLVGGAVAAWASVVVASLVVALELAVSGTSPLGVVLPAMGLVHALIGIGEGAVTLGVLTFLASTRRDLLTLHATRAVNAK